MPDYISGTDITAQGEQTESDTAQVFDTLAAAVCRMFDRECEVPDNFFNIAPNAGSETVKTIRANGTVYLNAGPYIANSITALTVDGADRFSDGSYHEQNGYLVWDDNAPAENAVVAVTARFGFGAVPSELIQACIEQALFMWRKKDPSFTQESGVSPSVMTAEFSPTFKAVTKRYRGLYSQNNYFA